MTRDEHLNREEIDRLVSRHSPALEGESLSSLAERARVHTEVCRTCRELLFMHEAAEREIRNFRTAAETEPGPDCPQRTGLLELAAGLTPAGRREELMNHVMSCDHCAPVFRQTLADFSDYTSPDEQNLLESLNSGASTWQKTMAGTLSRGAEVAARFPNVRRDHSLIWGMRPLRAVAAVVLAGFVVGSWLIFRRSVTAEQLLARAYSEQRILELRIPNARYAPLHIKRDATQSNLAKPASLLEAEALIARGLAQRPADPAWLEARGRAELLDWNYDSAITALKEAKEIQPESLTVKLDLASAFFERAEATGRAADYGPAIELLGQVLSVRPGDQTALFNRAIIYEKMFLYHEAFSDWEHYLKVDPDGAWAGEAKERLESLRKKIARQEESRKPLLSPMDFQARVHGTDESSWASVDERIEDYLEIAISKWLPQAYHDEEQSGNAKLALATLAEVLSTRHRDRWLRELLAVPERPHTKQAFLALSKSLESNRAGNPGLGRAYATQAELLFRQSSNRPGLLRAKTEELYALHRLFHGPECVQLASSLKDDLGPSQYAWIKTQIALEEYACWTSQARLDRGHALVAMALKLSEEAEYDTLHLRAIGFKAGLYTDERNVLRSWEWNRVGLERYWAGTYPPIRAYQFYDDLEVAVEEQRQLHLMLALQREAVAAISQTPNGSGEAMARFRLARVASEIGPIEEAAGNYERAGQLFAALPQDEATRTFEADSVVGLAELEVKSGSPDRAEERLEKIRASVEHLQAYTTKLNFYRTISEVRRLRGDNTGAEKACLVAVAIAERGLASIHTDQERRTWTNSSSDCYRSLVSARLNRDDGRGALELWEWYQGAPLRPTAVVGEISPEISSLLVERMWPALKHETLVTFAELPDGMVAWVYDDRGVALYHLPVRIAEVEPIANAFAAMCADPRSESERLRRDGRQLYSWLIAPLASHMETGRTVVVEADRGISKIPFEALIDSAGRYFGETNPVAYTPGAAFLEHLNLEDSVTSRDKALVVGNPTAQEENGISMIPLPHALEEARFVESRFERAVLLTGSEASASSVLRELPGAVVFHFAGHAVTNADVTGLVLSADPHNGKEGLARVLPGAELNRSTLRKCRLVVLSACATGRDSEVEYDTPANMARSFVQAGVPHVVASRWEVDSAVTEAFMKNFYEALLQGRNVPQALQLAGRVIRQSSGTPHPYYWAAFGVYGRG